ncbi:CAP-Gly domain-containing linker protein 1 [Smittium mucronatum]|uniref:CAP-Gly domain-containing linker protein 1 n=1 Tax=Smittium mucronatum TaxID=133383 RepID=A0A1R0GU67_9FUNG|nr:CAP-Gly domain-containing linker protein 1 [Smittium mucronatum]
MSQFQSNPIPTLGSSAHDSIFRGRNLLKNISESPSRKGSKSITNSHNNSFSNISTSVSNSSVTFPNFSNDQRLSSDRPTSNGLNSGNGLSNPTLTKPRESVSSSVSEDKIIPGSVPAFLKIGAPVFVNSINENGILRYLGHISAKPGVWAGVELDSSNAGKNDGSALGVRYFSCDPNKGIFVPPSKLSEIKKNTKSSKYDPSLSENNPKPDSKIHSQSRPLVLTESPSRTASQSSIPRISSPSLLKKSSSSQISTTKDGIPGKLPKNHRNSTSSNAGTAKPNSLNRSSTINPPKKSLLSMSRTPSKTGSISKPRTDLNRSSFISRAIDPSSNHNTLPSSVENIKSRSSQSNFQPLDIVTNSGVAALSNRKIPSALSNHNYNQSSQFHRSSLTNKTNRSSTENKLSEAERFEFREKSRIELLEAENRMLRLEKEQSKAELNVSRYFSQDLSLDNFSLNEINRNANSSSFDIDPDNSSSLELDLLNMERRLVQERDYFLSKIASLEAELASKTVEDKADLINNKGNFQSSRDYQSPTNSQEIQHDFHLLKSELLKTKDILEKVTLSAQENADLAQESQYACRQLEFKVDELDSLLNSTKENYESSLHYMKIVSEQISSVYMQIKRDNNHEPWLSEALLFDSPDQVVPKDFAEHAESALSEVRLYLSSYQNSGQNILPENLKGIQDSSRISDNSYHDTGGKNDPTGSPLPNKTFKNNNGIQSPETAAASSELINELEDRINELEQINLELIKERNDTALQTSQVRDYIYKLESESSRLIEDISILHSENIRLSAELDNGNKLARNMTLGSSKEQTGSPDSQIIGNIKANLSVADATASPLLNNNALISGVVRATEVSPNNNCYSGLGVTNSDEKDLELLKINHKNEITKVKQQMEEIITKKDAMISKLNEELNELEFIIENKVFKHSELEEKLETFQKDKQSFADHATENEFGRSDKNMRFDSKNTISNSNSIGKRVEEMDTTECELCNGRDHNILDCPTLNPPKTINTIKNSGENGSYCDYCEAITDHTTSGCPSSVHF